jgi:transcriptional regulator with XRE-family HTH domain
MKLHAVVLLNQGQKLSDNRLIAIGRRLRLARIDAGASLRDAGLRVGRSRQSIANWEEGSAEMSVLQIAGLADFYGVTVEYLVCGRLSFPEAEFSDSATERMLADFRKALKG